MLMAFGQTIVGMPEAGLRIGAIYIGSPAVKRFAVESYQLLSCLMSFHRRKGGHASPMGAKILVLGVIRPAA
jgi:hypothetical protein